MNKKKVALVTGSSSGIGYATSLLLSKSGFLTFASIRNLSKSKNLLDISRNENLSLKVIQLDVTNENSVNEAIKKILSEVERIDLLVNNAGYDITGSVEDLTIEEYKEQFETNFFGMLRVTKAVLPVMRKQKGGRIINISSVGGRVGIPLNSAYVSSKFAIEGLSESMRYELKDFGIPVILIEPGIVKSNFFENAKMAKRGLTDSYYWKLSQELFQCFISLMEKDYSTPEDVAKIVLTAATSTDPEVRYAVGKDASSIFELRKSFSDKDFERWLNDAIFKYKSFTNAN